MEWRGASVCGGGVGEKGARGREGEGVVVVVVVVVVVHVEEVVCIFCEQSAVVPIVRGNFLPCRIPSPRVRQSNPTPHAATPDHPSTPHYRVPSTRLSPVSARALFRFGATQPKVRLCASHTRTSKRSVRCSVSHGILWVHLRVFFGPSPHRLPLACLDEPSRGRSCLANHRHEAKELSHARTAQQGKSSLDDSRTTRLARVGALPSLLLAHTYAQQGTEGGNREALHK